MSNVSNINSSSNTQVPQNPIANNNSDKSLNAFYILAEAMSKSVEMASKSLDSQTLEQNEKQAILRELQNITDLDRKKALIKFLIKTLGLKDSDLKTWLTGLEEQNQNTINKIWKMLYGYYQNEKNVVTDGGSPLLSKIEKDDSREKRSFGHDIVSQFRGDYELDPELSNQRLELINNIKELMQNPDEAASNFDQLASDFQGLQSIVKQEQNTSQCKPANWWQKNVIDKANNGIKGILNGDYKKIVDIALPGAYVFEGIATLIGKGLSIPNDFQRKIIKDSSSLATRGLEDLQSADNAISIMRGQYEIDANTVSSKIEKAEDAQNKYNDLLENSLPSDSKLISNLNYINKV